MSTKQGLILIGVILVLVLLGAAMSGQAQNLSTPYEYCNAQWNNGAGSQTRLDRHTWMMQCMDGR